MVKLIKIQHYFSLNKKRHQIFNHLNLEFIQWGNVLITGDSGVGKSTLLQIIYGSIKPRKGKIDYDKIIKSDIRYFSQDFQLSSEFLVSDYIKIFNITSDWMKQVCLEELPLSMSAMFLSGGEVVRFYLMLLVIQEPKTLLLDEPTHALDQFNVNKVIQIIDDAIGLKIIATHDQRLQYIANQTVNLEDPFTYSITSTKTFKKEAVHSKKISINFKFLKKKIRKTFFKFSFLEAVYQLSRFQLQAMLITFPTLLLTLNVYQHNLLQSSLPFHVSYLTESIKEDIPNSPFQIVKYQQPTFEKTFKLFQGFSGVEVDQDYSQILPKTISYNNITYEIRMTNLPFYSDAFSVFVVGPLIDVDKDTFILKYTIEDPTISFRQVISLERNLHVLGTQKIRSPLEKPIIYFSVMQIKIFAKKFPIQHPNFDFLASYIESLASDYLVLTIENTNTFFQIEKALESNLTYTLINLGRVDQKTQETWFLLLKESIWFLLWLTVVVFVFFTSMIFIFYREKTSQIFTAFVRLGVPKLFFINLMRSHFIQNGLLESLTMIALMYVFYIYKINEFIQGFAYLMFLIFIVSLYQLFNISLITFHFSKKRIL